ncbi:acetyl-CoA C-acetyltransferase, partial [Burkholderia contaminans]|nr:acetyl-CoA C-acetyltransferase [Burkholderia contaminans]
MARDARSPAEVGTRRRQIDQLISMQELDMTDVVIVSAARTAVGKFGGSLAKIAA